MYIEFSTNDEESAIVKNGTLQFIFCYVNTRIVGLHCRTFLFVVFTEYELLRCLSVAGLQRNDFQPVLV